MQHAILRQQQSATLRYQNHVVAVMVTQGEGEMRVISPHNKKKAASQEHPSYKLSSGSFFALNAAETVEIEAMTKELHLVRYQLSRSIIHLLHNTLLVAC